MAIGMAPRNAAAALDGRGDGREDGRMKVCHVITRMIVGGAMENTLLTCEGLHALGHEVTLITGPAIGPEGELMTRARAGGYRVIELPPMRREIHPGRDRASYRRLVELLRELRPDIMHSHASKAGILARKAAAKVGGIGIVHTIHGLPFHPYQSWLARRLFIGLERRAARRPDALISVADAMTRQALDAGVGRPEQFTTIYSGMEVEAFLHRPAEADAWRASFRVPPGGTLVMQVSRIAPLKGHEFLLAAAEKLPDERIVFAFVGDGPWKTEIEAQINERNLASRFRLTGLVDPAEIPALLHAADVVAHCSLREGLARAMPQAMLAGKPVISYEVDGAGEVVNHNTGILLDPGDIPGLVAAIEVLAETPALREQLGAAGRELCRERFDHHRMVEAIERVYEDVLARRAAADRNR